MEASSWFYLNKQWQGLRQENVATCVVYLAVPLIITKASLSVFIFISYDNFLNVMQ